MHTVGYCPRCKRVIGWGDTVTNWTGLACSSCLAELGGISPENVAALALGAFGIEDGEPWQEDAAWLASQYAARIA